MSDLLRTVFNTAMSIRAVELQLLDGYKQRYFGGTLHTCIGQEILPSVVSHVFSNDPFVFSNHRGHGHYIAHVRDKISLFKEFLGKKGAPSSGIGGSQHLHADNFLSNGIQGNTAPFSVGVGMARPTIIYLGDGTFGEGTLYEALNLSKISGSQICFIVEDNQISQTTPSGSVLAGNFSSKFSAFDIPCVDLDSADPKGLCQGISEVFDEWNNERIVGVVVRSYRLGSHSKGDDTRPKSVVNNLPDPLQVLSEILGLSYQEELDSVSKEIEAIWSSVLRMEDDSYSYSTAGHTSVQASNYLLPNIRGRINEHIRNSIAIALEKGALFVGEDVITRWNKDDSPYGGAFGVSYGLSDKSNNKVIGTSISEAGITGLAGGYAFASNKLSIVEIMFADFSTLIIDQLVNGVDKFRKMFGKSIAFPLIIRLPYGMGRGYGPTHSQAPFELFSYLTEITVISYNPFVDYSKILEKVASNMLPVVVFEPKSSYGERVEDWYALTQGLRIENLHGDIVPNVLVSNNRFAEVRIITHGSAVRAVLEAVQSLTVAFELLIVSELYSSQIYRDWLADSKTPIVVLEEKNSEFGPLSTVVSMVLSKSNANVELYTNDPVYNIPANTDWEKSLMLNSKKIIDIVIEALS